MTECFHGKPFRISGYILNMALMYFSDILVLGSHLNVCNLNTSYLSHDAIACDAKTEFHHAIGKRYGNDPKNMGTCFESGRLDHSCLFCVATEM